MGLALLSCQTLKTPDQPINRSRLREIGARIRQVAKLEQTSTDGESSNVEAQRQDDPKPVHRKGNGDPAGKEQPAVGIVRERPLSNPTPVVVKRCSTSRPDPGDYTVTVCLDDPPTDADLIGPQRVSASVNLEGTDQGIRRVVFYLDGEYLLTDYESPYSFILPTNLFADGPRILEVEAVVRDEFASERAVIKVAFNNGTSEPPVNKRSASPSAGLPPEPGQALVVAAVGDGAGGEDNAQHVTDRIASWNPHLVLYLGDVYERGTLTEFYNWYGISGQFYGRFRSITNPVVGNHEYESDRQASGYFAYWDNIPSYYSFDAGGWHFVALNSNCAYSGGCDAGSAQEQWLRADLKATAAQCKMAYFHHPRFSIGPHGDQEQMQPIWQALYDGGVSIVLAGHEHHYQRWRPLNDQGLLDPAGITQLIVGGGGHGVREFAREDDRMMVGFDTQPAALGALRLELNESWAVYHYINSEGKVLDSGIIPCPAAPTDPTPPSEPTNVIAATNSSSHVNLTWSPSTDDTVVLGYTIYRDGTALATVDGLTLSYTDASTQLATTYSYTVEAFDLSGNNSPPSAPTLATTPATAEYVFTPVADAYVNESKPTQNYGYATVLRLDASPRLNSYLRFDVRGIAGVVTRATLRLYAEADSATGYEVHSVPDNDWEESQITYDNAPPTGNVAGLSGPFEANTWTSVNVTALITGEGSFANDPYANRPFSLALTTSHDTATTYTSRETDANAPQLVIETKAGSPQQAVTPAMAEATPVAGAALPVEPAGHTAAPAPPPTPKDEPAFPIRAAFYYPRFPEAWSQKDTFPYTNFNPSLGFYDSADHAVIRYHIDAMQYAHIDAGIASWSGPGSPSDARFSTLLALASDVWAVREPPLRWAVYYEDEGQHGNPSVSEITRDLTYFRDKYGSHPNFLRIDGRFVVFVWADPEDGCDMAERWVRGNTIGSYIVLKVFPGYRNCPSQPDGWHEYAPAQPTDHQAGYSFTISPGFWKVGESPHLERDLQRWNANIRDMIASGEPFQLITSFNEWGEGTPVESTHEWASPSGYGLYLDALHNNGLAGPTNATLAADEGS